MTGGSGVVQSPNFPNNYPTDYSCEWLIDVGDNFTIKVTFTDFDTKSYNDYIEVRYSPYYTGRTRTGNISII